jgi:hypothetical protein
LQKDLENDEVFYKGVVSTFSTRVSSLTYAHRRENKLPSSTRMKHINACWLRRLKILREMIGELDVLKSKRGDIFFKLIDLMKELNGPNLLMGTMLSTKETLIDQLNALKVVWENEFTETIEFFEEEVEKWLVIYINRNYEVDETLHQSGMDLK